MSASDPFTLLRREHKQLTMLFQRHQEALLTRSWARAARLLAHYRDRLGAHIRIEDEWLLPYAENGTAVSRWSPRVYRGEHQKLLKLSGKLDAQLALARRRGVTPAMLLALLDEEKTLKNVFEHHHQREEQDLFDGLPEHLPGAARAGLRAALLSNQAVN